MERVRPRTKDAEPAAKYNDIDSPKSTTDVTKYMKTRKRKTRNEHDEVPLGNLAPPGTTRDSNDILRLVTPRICE